MTDLPVRRRPLGGNRRPLDGTRGNLERPRHQQQALVLIAAGENLLLGVGGNLHRSGHRVRQGHAVVDLGVAGGAGHLLGECAKARHHIGGDHGIGSNRLVIDQAADGRREVQVPFGLLQDLHRLDAQHDDVQSAIVEALNQLVEARGATDRLGAGFGGTHNHERVVVEHAVGVELPVTRLEEMQGDALTRQQNEVEGEETQVAGRIHAPSIAASVPVRPLVPSPTVPPDSLPPNLIRPALADVAPYQPGRPVDDLRRELGLERIVKLASNEGPHPPFPSASAAIAAEAAGTRVYPDPGCWALRDALSARLGVDAARILVGNGVDSLIKLLCLATLDPGDELAMCWPSFVSWRQGAGIQGAAVRAAALAADGSYDLEALAAEITPRTKLVVVVSPNNPTGQAVTAQALERFLDGLPPHVLPIIDEAYFEYLPPASHDAVGLIRAGRQIVALRTFSKAYGLAGLRVGYMVASEPLLAALARVRNAFDVNVVAQAAALASLTDGDTLLAPRMAEIATERAMTASGLRALGLEPLPSTANFLLVPMGSPERATAVNEALLRQGVIVRPAGPFGAPDCLRITIGFAHENAIMLAALAGALMESSARPLSST